MIYIYMINDIYIYNIYTYSHLKNININKILNTSQRTPQKVTQPTRDCRGGPSAPSAQKRPWMKPGISATMILGYG